MKKFIKQCLFYACILLVSIMMMPKPVTSQEIQPGILYFHVLADEARPASEGSRAPLNKVMADLFDQYGVTSFKQAAPFARTRELHDVYYINCLGDVVELKKELEQSSSDLLTNFMLLQEPEVTYEPNDGMWRNTVIGNSLWYLYKIQADSA